MSLIEKIDAEIERLRKCSLKMEPGSESRLICRVKIDELYKIKPFVISEQKALLTVGDKIRESNENLAEWSRRYQDDTCVHGCDGNCDNHKNCDDALLNYLNQPYTETN